MALAARALVGARLTILQIVVLAGLAAQAGWARAAGGALRAARRAAAEVGGGAALGLGVEAALHCRAAPLQAVRLAPSPSPRALSGAFCAQRRWCRPAWD